MARGAPCCPGMKGNKNRLPQGRAGKADSFNTLLPYTAHHFVPTKHSQPPFFAGFMASKQRAFQTLRHQSLSANEKVVTDSQHAPRSPRDPENKG